MASARQPSTLALAAGKNLIPFPFEIDPLAESGSDELTLHSAAFCTFAHSGMWQIESRSLGLRTSDNVQDISDGIYFPSFFLKGGKNVSKKVRRDSF